LKEGSEAGQSADQQADCGKIDSNTRQSDCGEKKICRCESCDVCYYQWRRRHEWRKSERGLISLTARLPNEWTIGSELWRKLSKQLDIPTTHHFNFWRVTI